MDAFLSQLQELLSQGYIQVLIGLYIVAQIWWWVKIAIGTRNIHATSGFNGSYAVVVAAYRPSPERFTKTLKSIVAHGSPSELIVVLDDAPHAPKRLKTIAAKYATKVIELPQRLGTREQYAAAAEGLSKRANIIISVSADAQWNATTSQILTPFTDDTIGAVSAREVIEPTATFSQKLARWFTDAHFAVTAPFQSAFGAMRPVSAHIVAVRRDIFTTSVIAKRNETFLGRRAMTTQNETLANSVITAGFRSVYQPLATVTVQPPESLTVLRKNLVQQHRGALRSFLRNIAMVGKTNPLVTIALAATLFSPVIYISILAVAVFMLAYDTYQFGTSLSVGSLAAACAIAAVAYIALSYLRHLPTLKNNALWLPAFVLFGGLLNLWAKTIALFTFAENAHDSKTYTQYGEGKVGRSRTVVVGITVVLFVLTLPVAYFALVHPQNVPFNAIISGQGRAYIAARNMSAQLRDTVANNDPTDENLLQFIRANGAHYNQNVNEALAAEAYDCVRTTLRESALHNVLDNTQACYAHAQAVAESKKTEIIAEPDPIVRVVAKPGDTLTYLVRAEVKKLDAKNELSAAQAVYIETTYLSQTQQLDHYIEANEDVQVNIDNLKTLIGNAKQLTAEQTAAWDCYSVNVVW